MGNYIVRNTHTNEICTDYVYFEECIQFDSETVYEFSRFNAIYVNIIKQLDYINVTGHLVEKSCVEECGRIRDYIRKQIKETGTTKYSELCEFILNLPDIRTLSEKMSYDIDKDETIMKIDSFIELYKDDKFYEIAANLAVLRVILDQFKTYCNEGVYIHYPENKTVMVDGYPYEFVDEDELNDEDDEDN